MAYYKPMEIADLVVDAGVKKVRNSLLSMLVLGFLGGAFISLGFLLDIRVIAGAPKEWGSIASFVGATIFPVGLVMVILAGAELLTGNMMAVPLARFAGKIKTSEMILNLVIITLANFVGAVFVAYFFGHVVGLTHSGVYLDKLVDLADHKLQDSFLKAFISGIGCNWLVALAVWITYSADNVSGKILGLWFPIMAFVAIGFQHVVANMFLIPAAIFEGHFSWGQYFPNFAAVWLGNLVGGGLFVAMAYYLAYLKQAPVSAQATTKPAAAKPGARNHG
jgi:formate transporter